MSAPTHIKGPLIHSKLSICRNTLLYQLLQRASHRIMPYQVTLEKKHHLNQSGLEAGLPAPKSCPCTRRPPSGGRQPPRPSQQLHGASPEGSVSGAAIQPSLPGSEAAICRLFALAKTLPASLKAGVQDGGPHKALHHTQAARCSHFTTNKELQDEGSNLLQAACLGAASNT